MTAPLFRGGAVFYCYETISHLRYHINDDGLRLRQYTRQ